MIDVIELKRRINIKEALTYYGIEFNRYGFARCPFHSEKKESLHTKGNIFICFGCGIKGDIVNFVQMTYHLDFKDALEKIDIDFGLGLGNSKYKLTAEDIRLNDIIIAAEKAQAEKEKKIYDLYCDEIRTLEKALRMLNVESEAGQMLLGRITEIEADMDDTSGTALQIRYEREKNE